MKVQIIMHFFCLNAFLILPVQMNIWTFSRTFWPTFYNNRPVANSYYPYKFSLYNRYFPSNFQQLSLISGRSYPWINAGRMDNRLTKMDQYPQREEAYYNSYQSSSVYPIYSNQWNAYNN